MPLVRSNVETLQIQAVLAISAITGASGAHFLVVCQKDGLCPTARKPHHAVLPVNHGIDDGNRYKCTRNTPAPVPHIDM